MKNIITSIIFGIILVILVGTTRGVPGNLDFTDIQKLITQVGSPFESSHERAYYAVLLALDERRTFALSENEMPLVHPDVGIYDGRYYILQAVGTPLLLYPFYYFGKTIGYSQFITYLGISLFAFGNSILIYYIVHKILKGSWYFALVSSLTFIFATSAWAYGITLYQHNPTTFFMLLSFVAAWKYKSHNNFSFLWGSLVWLSYAIAIWIDYPNALFLLPTMFYFLFSSVNVSTTIKKSVKVVLYPMIVVSSLVFILISVLHGYYNYVNFGSPLQLSGSLPSVIQIEETKPEEKKNMDELLKELAENKKPVSFFQEEHLVTGAKTFFIDDDRALFLFYPVLLLGVLGIVFARPKNGEYSTLIAFAVMNILVYGSFGDHWGGWAFGSRFLIITMSILSIFTGVFLSGVSKRFSLIARVGAFVLLVYSTLVAALGGLTTNLVPPKVEAVYLGIEHYNFMHTIQFLQKDISGSFIYNQFLGDTLSLFQYYCVLITVIVILYSILLFVIPYKTDEN